MYFAYDRSRDNQLPDWSSRLLLFLHRLAFNSRALQLTPPTYSIFVLYIYTYKISVFCASVSTFSLSLFQFFQHASRTYTTRVDTHIQYKRKILALVFL